METASRLVQPQALQCLPWLVAAVLVLVGCVPATRDGTSTPPVTTPTAAAASKPTSGPVPDAKVNLPTGAGASTWEEDWSNLIQQARSEGKLVVAGPANPDLRTELPRAFKAQFGVELEYQAGTGPEHTRRLSGERAVPIYSTDVLFAGAASMYTTVEQENMLQPFLPLLIHPDALDKSKWFNGELWFGDPEKRVLRFTRTIVQTIAVNTSMVDPNTLRSWNDLLRPEFKGRIASIEPTDTVGFTQFSYLYKVLGADYVRGLIQDQELVVTKDGRELADWLARGKYPIALALTSSELLRLQKDSLPVAYVPHPPEATGALVSGLGTVGVLNNAPHPNAAKLFANWIAMKDGMEVYSKYFSRLPARSDIRAEWVTEAGEIPQPGVKYMDAEDREFVQSEQQEILKALRGMRPS